MSLAVNRKRKNLLLTFSILALLTVTFVSFFPPATPHQLFPPKIPVIYDTKIWDGYHKDGQSRVQRIPQNKSSINLANALLNNQFSLGSRWPSYKFDGNFSWREDPFHNDTWQVYFQNLDIVGHLTNAYESTSDFKYLKKAESLILDWYKTNPSPFFQVSKFAWYDMVAAVRTMNILHFEKVYGDQMDATLRKKLNRILQKHGDFLVSNYYYSFDSNHGLFQDQALISLALTHPEFEQSKEWLIKGLNRFLMRLKADISDSGVHKEQSPTYHLLILKMIESVNQAFTEHHIEIAEFQNWTPLMQTYLAYVVKEDKSIPNVGDSDPTINSYLLRKDSSNPYLLFVQSDGKKGTPLESFKSFIDAGTAFFRDPKFNLYTMFTSRFHRTVHKHGDDLSFILSLRGTDFFVDSGKYNYQLKDPWRKYFLSAKAHNTIIVDGNSYEIPQKNIEKSRIEKFIDEPIFAAAIASHDLYPGVHIKRNFIYIKTGSFIIFDQITSQSNHTYSQLFQIGTNIKIFEMDRGLTLESEDKKNVELLELTGAKSQIITGQTDPIQGWLSTKWADKKPISTVFFNSNGSNVEFKNIININPKQNLKNFEPSVQKGLLVILLEYKDGKKLEIRLND
jgi:hypothetical protein